GSQLRHTASAARAARIARRSSPPSASRSKRVASKRSESRWAASIALSTSTAARVGSSRRRSVTRSRIPRTSTPSYFPSVGVLGANTTPVTSTPFNPSCADRDVGEPRQLTPRHPVTNGNRQKIPDALLRPGRRRRVPLHGDAADGVGPVEHHHRLAAARRLLQQQDGGGGIAVVAGADVL